MKRLKKNIYTVATNERAITGSANVLCATKWFITAKIMIADYQQKGEHIMADLKIFTENIEHEALNQIYTLVKQPAFSDCKIRIMPDVHAGAGCVIGFTADLGEKVIPNIVGVDIGCGMFTTNLGNIDIDFERLDNIIREYVPSGRKVHEEENSSVASDIIEKLYCKEQLKNIDWLKRSCGTLGGGNHFIEVDSDSKDANGKTLVILDNKGLTLDSSVKIAWDNVADTTAKVTQITKDTVTTSYVNALSVKAGSVDAEGITGTTITGKNIVGGTIDIGNGVFVVDNDGKVTASNFNMSGGSIVLNGNLSNSTIDLTATDNSGNNYELWMNGAVLRIVKNDENLITLYGVTGSIGAQTMYAQEIGSDKFRETDRGYAMCGNATGHTYHCDWDDTALWFQVDDAWVWNSSDKRLKKNIKAINQDYIDAVGSVDLFQYNLNRQGYSDKPLYFGAMAQDIIESLKDKGHADENLNMIFNNKVTSDDDTLYYGMNYEQFLILRLAGGEQKIDKMQKRIDELEDKFSRLCQKLGIDESEV